MYRVRFAITTEAGRRLNIRRNFPVCGSLKKKNSSGNTNPRPETHTHKH
jgi:hypothetical protein